MRNQLLLTPAVSLLLTLAASAAGFETLTNHWNFDEGPDWHDDPFQSISTATAVADSVGTNDATLHNMDGSAFVSGRQYTGLAFDGVDDSLQTTADLAPVLGSTASLSFWIKTSQTGAALASDAPGLLGSAGVQWGWIDHDGRIVLGVDGTAAVRSAEPVNDDLWHHIVLTRDHASGAVQVFLDGALSASGAWATGTRTDAISRIAHMQNGSAALFQGTLDQLHVFSGVIEAPTVATLYDNHAPKTWPMSCDGENLGPFGTGSLLVSTYVYDAEQDTISVVSFTQPSNGSVTANADGSFDYTASSGYTGADSFTAIITDGRGGFTGNTVNILVTGPSPAGSENRTTVFENFAEIEAGGAVIAHDSWRMPRAIDWEGDGDNDLLIGDDTGVWRYENTGTPTAPVFAAGVKVQAAGIDITLSGHILIALADMTGDGVDDLIAVNNSRKIHVHPNTAPTGQVPVYAAAVIVQSSAGGDFVLPDQRFDIADWDGDGLLDVVMGRFCGDMHVYRNVGNTSIAQFDPADFEVIDSGCYNYFPRVFDLNLNGTPDYIRSVNWGNISFWFDPSRATDGGLGGQDGNLSITDTGGAPVAMKPPTDGAMCDFADFNDDGVLDLVVGGHAGDRMFLAYGVAKTVTDSIAEIEAIYDANPTGLGAALEANSQALLNQIKSAESNILTHMQASTLTERQAMFAQMVAHVGSYTFLQMGSSLDKVEYNHVPSIVGQNLMTMHEMLPDTPGHRVAVADAVGLTNVQREIYLQTGLHVGDNQESPAGRIEAVRDFMAFQPRESFPDAAITLDHYGNNGRGGWVSSFRGAKNTFNFGEGQNSSEWASDLQSAVLDFYGSAVDRGDYFTFVMGHEVTHSLDGYCASRANKDLFRRRGQFINLAAGPDVVDANGTNYDGWNLDATKARFLAEGYWDGDNATWTTAWDDYWNTGPGSVFNSLSMMRINAKFFLGAPQESMATQANHHWAHAEGRLVGAIDRWNRSISEGIEPMKANLTEVTTFLDWISCGTNKIVMQDTEGVAVPNAHAEFFPTHAWLERDANGYVTKVTTSKRIYEVAVDADGIVTGLVSSPLPQADDAVDVIVNTANLIRPLGNDGNPVDVVSFTQPSNGSVARDARGALIYTPGSTFTGSDSFTYVGDSVKPTAAQATVALDVQAASAGLNPPIVTNPAADQVVEENSNDLVIDISSVFSDADVADVLKLEVIGNSEPALISPSLVGQTLTLTVRPAAAGVAALTLRASDPGGAVATQSFNVSVSYQAPDSHLRFDETTGTTASDSTGNGWDGSLVGDTTWTAGRINGAVDLDGDGDYLTLPTGIVSGMTDFSMAMWLRWDGGGLQAAQRVFEFGSSSTTFMSLTTSGVNGNPSFGIRTLTTPEQTINSDTALAIGQWVHVAVTLEGGTGTLYLDGVPVGTNSAMTLSPNDLGATGQNFLGHSQLPTEPDFDGAIDEFHLYDRALNAFEVDVLCGPPAAPINLNATPGDGQITLSWPPVAGASGYNLQRSLTNGGPYETISARTNATGFIDTDVAVGTDYFYMVTAVRSIAESGNSAEVTATPLNALQVWRLAHFGSAENSGNASDDADPDGDGWTNLAEFALGGDPDDATSTPDAAISWQYDDATDQFTLTFPRLLGGVIDYQVLFSDDLQNWQAAAVTENVATPIDASFELASFTETSTTATERRRFVTLSIADQASADPATVLTEAACGYYHFKPPAGSSAWTAGLVKAKSHSGQIDSVAGSILTENDANFDSDALIGSFIEILAPSPHAGAIFDITANTVTTITVGGDLVAYGLSGDENFAVREHVTLGELLSGGGGLQPPSDSLTLYYDDGSSQTFLLVDLGGGDLNWFLPPATLANDEVIYPGQGFVIQANAERDLLIGQSGVAKVKFTPTVAPVFANATNFIGLINPLVSEDTGVPSTVRLADTGLLDTLKPSTTSTFSNESVTLFSRAGGQLSSTGTFFTFDSGSGPFFYIPPSTVADDEPVDIGSAFSIDVESDTLYRQTFQLPSP